jgi:hypothetical protein
MSTYYLRNTTERPHVVKSLLGTLLPLSLKRHVLYLKHYRRFGNFRSPRLFSEKLQWRIINDRRENLRYTCDKRAASRVAAERAARAGDSLRIPRQIAWGSSAGDFLTQLRAEHAAGRVPDRWVMKPNHSSGRALAVEGEPDWSVIEQAAHAWLRPSRFTGLHWIWPYVVAEPGLLAEEFVAVNATPFEWQLWIFDGAIRYAVVQERASGGLRRCAFNSSWETVDQWYNNLAEEVPIAVPPDNWERIARVARALAEGLEMVRVDLFDDREGGIWFGELTPYPHEGLIATSEAGRAFDEQAGALWRLPPNA